MSMPSFRCRAARLVGALALFAALAAAPPQAAPAGVNDGFMRFFRDSGQSLGEQASNGAALGDLDGDGLPDLLLANASFCDDLRGLPERGVAKQGVFDLSTPCCPVDRACPPQSSVIAFGRAERSGSVQSAVFQPSGPKNRRLHKKENA